MKKQTIQERSKLRWTIIALLTVLVLAVGFIVPRFANPIIGQMNRFTGLGIAEIDENFKLGLDLQGGAHLIYRADVSQVEEVDRGAAVEGVKDAIERRVNGSGVGEANIQTARVAGEYRLNVDLPGIEDVNEAITMIGATPILEFREPNDEPPRQLTEEELEQLATENEDAKARAEAVLAEMNDGLSFEDAVLQYTEDDSSKNNEGYIGFLTRSEVEFLDLYNWAEDAQEGDVSNSVIESDIGFHILKRGGEEEGPEKVEARHILVCYFGTRGCSSDRTKEEAEQRAQELFEEANASNFATLAEENSDDPGSAPIGGDLGLFERGAMIPAFEDAVFEAEVGRIIGPLETEFGYHIIYKEDQRQDQEYELSHIMIRKTLSTDIVPLVGEWSPTQLSGKQLDRADVVTDPNTGALQISLNFDSEGSQLFEELTRRNIGRQIAIYLDGSPISIPNVSQAIAGGQAVITGSFTIEEARLLAQRLNTGALPVPIELVSQQSVGASLGAETLSRSLYAGSVAIVLVMIFMILYYRVPGILSVLSLSLYIALTLAIFKLIGVTLTLAGIAGFILSVGMAVDANVLIFERLKEELKQGKSLRVAVEEGFLRAWTSIRDGNVSTLITCGFLIWFGSSFVQGFSATLAIGILISMFSAITASRMFLRFVVPWFGRYGSSKAFLGARSGAEHTEDQSSDK